MVEKQLFRKRIQAKLALLGEGERLEKSRQAVSRLLASAEYSGAQAVLAYDSFGVEVGIHEILEDCIQSGKKLGLPRTQKHDHSMTVHVISDLKKDLEYNKLGFREPKIDLSKLPLKKIDLIIVPGIAFDLKGNRLGRGLGYYDRFLQSAELNAVICALAFECQVVPTLPTEAHDKRIDFLFTEDRVIRS